jgi:MYXO-CTERM domain-containing protein
LSAWAGAASAYCREITAPTPPSFDPATSPTGCWAGDGNPVDEVYWRNLCVSYSLQQNGTNQLPFPMVRQIAAQAFAAWSLPPCSSAGSPSITADELEPPGQSGVACDQVQYNPYGPNQNLVVFRDNGWSDGDAVNTLGLTTVTYSKRTGEILDADMELNSSPAHPLVLSPPDPAGSYDLLSVMTHEAGHFLGLAHSADTSAVMYAFYQPGSITLQPDDIQGICAIYPPDGTRSTSAGPVTGGQCCNVPVGGLASDCAPDGPDGSVIPAPSAMPEAVAVSPCSTSEAPPPSGKSGGCGVGGEGTGSPWGALLVGVAALGGRLRRVRRRLRPLTLALLVAIPGAGALMWDADARASVAIAVSLEELARGAAGVAMVTSLEQRAAWENGRIITRTRVRIDRLVAGDLPSEAWLRTRGGVVGEIGQIVEGEPSFALGQTSLVFLRPHTNDEFAIAGAPTFVVAERAQGQYAIVADARGALRLAQGRAGLLLSAAASPARALLHGRLVEDAVRDVAAVWARTH